MKQRKFRKVIKADKGHLTNSWACGLISIILPLMLLVGEHPTFSTIVSYAFLDGVSFTIFIFSLTKYVFSRKVFYKEIKK